METSRKALRQLASAQVDRSIELVGIPDEVADRMAGVIDVVMRRV